MSSLYGQPAVYDLLFFGWSADLDHYAALAAEASGPVLECAVGSGRVALRLARSGHRVHGIDLDPAMLAAFAARVAAEPEEVRARLSWSLGDLRTFETGERYRLVIAAFNAIAHLHDDADLDAFLARVRRELGPGGVLAFDVWRPDDATLRGRVSDSPRFLDPRTNEPVRCTERTGVDAATGLLRVELALHGLDEAPPEVLALSLRIRSEDALRAALSRSDFVVERVVDLGEMQGWACRQRGSSDSGEPVEAGASAGPDATL